MHASPATSRSVDDSRGPFVGRDRELDELRTGLDGALAGQGRFFMLIGEPGIGKTRLAEQIASHGADRGAATLWGRCSEEGDAPAYWPWIQVIRAAIRDLEPDTLAARIGASAIHLAPLIPELRELLPGLPEARSEPPADPDRARFHLFDAATSFLRNVATVRPLVVVLDDLHAADRPSLLLLGLLARELRDAAVLLLGCYRELEVRRNPELSALLGDVGPHARRLPLRGISEVDVGRYIERTAGFVPPASVVGAVHRATDGNPFFVEEVVGLLAAEGHLTSAVVPGRLGIPEGVREAIRRRLAPIEDVASQVLSAAAVIGRRFDVACLERVVGKPRGWLLEVLDECLALGVVQEIADAPGRYVFSHALIRDTLYQDLPATKRLDLHRRIGSALEELYGADREPHLPELAHHFFTAAPVGDAAKALEYCVAAAERACRLLACEEAIAHYERALRTLAFVDVGDTRRCELLQALGEAQDIAGDIEGAKVTFHRAAQIARALHAPDLLARAALGAGGQWATKFTASPFDKSDIGLLEEALGALGASDLALRAKLLARLALSLFLAGRREPAIPLGVEAVDLARQLDTPGVLGYALRVRHGGLAGPDHCAERLLVSAELEAMARATGDRELALRSQALRVLDLLEAGDGELAEAALQEHARLADELRDPFDLWHSMMTHATWAHMRGRLDESERRSQEALAIARSGHGQQSAEENADACEMVQAFFCRRERGTLDGFEGIALHWADRYVTLPSMRCIAAAVFVELGREAEARQQFERLAASDFAIIPRDVLWLGAMPLIAQTAVALGDVARAALLYDLLLPFEHRVSVTVSPACSGSVARFLGLLATLLGRLDDAQRHFELALGVNARLGAHGHHAHTQADYAAMLIARDETLETRTQARSLLRDALMTARELGFVTLADRVLRLTRHLDDPLDEQVPTDTARDAAVRDDYVLRREGEYWTIAFGGTTVRLRTSRGLALLAILLRHPGVPVRAIDLVADGPPADAARRVLFFGDAGEVLDVRAKRAYELRAEQLSEMLAHARSAGDGESAASVHEELGFVRAELSRGVGIGGRPRRAASNEERARVSATRALRGAIDKIADVHTALGQHLRVTIRTGTTCAYVPDPRLPATWIT
ncbi:MAG TPA: AAA family ATPase [Candidatus Binatia bacterium]|jgi:tetratricopeptide (TPR) repeat protein|nr:AAA family ATPase [Candidatus Binatia bacterium]